jgi:hypothetical protein
MRIETGLVCAALLLTGCLHRKQPASPPPPQPQNTYITPDFATVGRVEMVNTQGRFAVLSFPLGRVPPPGQLWRIRHQGLKVGRVKISGPQRETDTVADIIEGDANVGDDAAPE